VRRILLIALAALLPIAALHASSTVAVSGAWMRALPGGLPAGGYFTLHNGTAKTLTLQGAASPACGSLMLHKSDTMGGMASMSDVKTIDVAPGGTLKFSPGGYHLMCMAPRDGLKRGARVAVTFDFTDGTKLKTAFDVRGANGK
jgi:periplasmic copper chaperone A